MTKSLTQRKMPITRQSITHEFKIGGFAGYLTVGMYEDGNPGEIFINVSKEGSTISGLLDTIAISVSFALQYGVPLEKLVNKFSHMRFEPAGFTGEEFGFATSIVDYVFRWLGKRFVKLPKGEPVKTGPQVTLDAPACTKCGGLMQRAGSCFTCTECGETSGCS
jgi:ribonucleoside-diphosphate reductase alpha chain